MKLHSISGYIQNIHLVEYPHGCLLLDGCCKNDFVLIKEYFLNVLKRPLSDLKILVVTHMHPDHAGCAHKLRRISGCKIVTGTFKIQWYAGVSGRLAHFIDIALALWVANRLGRKRENIWYSPILKPDMLFQDKQVIPNFSDWEIIHTPGHTDRDISLVNHREKLIYVADLVVSVKKKFVPPFPIYLPEEYKRSLTKLKAFNGYTMLMAHVAPTLINEQNIDQLISKAPKTPQTNLTAIRKKIKRFSRLKAK